MKYLTKNPKTCGYKYNTEERLIEYFDIFFAAYDSRILKAERVVIDKKTGEKTYWRAWFRLPEELAVALDIDNILTLWPPKEPQIIAQFEAWLEERLLDESKWLPD